MENINYTEAEALMRQAKEVRRKAWPVGKKAYYDIDLDGKPDELDINSPDFVKNAIANYEKFRRAIRIAIDGIVQPGAWITQADSLESDWELVE